MKKLIIILIAATSFNAASAQTSYNSYKKQDRHQVTQTNDNYDYSNQSLPRDYNAYHKTDDHKDYAFNSPYNRNEDQNRQGQYDQADRRYDQKIRDYQNDRSIKASERNRRNNDAQQERQRSRAGGVVGFLLGVLVSH